MSTSAPARVVVVDDSALMRSILARSLQRVGVQVVGSASNGEEALALCDRERPDAMTLDLAMPGLDGMGVLRALRERGATSVPVVVVSAFSPAHGARAVDCLAEGAFDLVAKPAVGEGLDTFAEALGEKVKLAAASRRRLRPATNGAAPRPLRPQVRSRVSRAIVIATSTGGPRALARVVPQLRAPLGIGTLIVQHMPPGFTGSLASRLDSASALTVREAAGGETLEPGLALIAPGGLHLRLLDGGTTTLSEEPAVGGLRPRADLLIEDAARIYRDRLLLVVLTGMGNDGLRGAREVRRYGGRIIVEAEESCTVFGMPRSIIEAELADDVIPLEKMATAIATEAR